VPDAAGREPSSLRRSVLIVLHYVTRKNPQAFRELSTKVRFPARDGAPEQIEHTDIQLSAPLHLPFARFKSGFWELLIVCIHVSLVSTFSCIITYNLRNKNWAEGGGTGN
jgi:hypothetical protein